jgi:hypothetical protein
MKLAEEGPQPSHPTAPQEHLPCKPSVEGDTGALSISFTAEGEMSLSTLGEEWNLWKIGLQPGLALATVRVVRGKLFVNYCERPNIR